MEEKQKYQTFQIHDELIIQEPPESKDQNKLLEDIKKLTDLYVYKVDWESSSNTSDPYKVFTEPPWTVQYKPIETIPMLTTSKVIGPYYNSYAQQYKEQGIHDNKNVYIHINDYCLCGQTGGTHLGIPPFKHSYNDCQGFILKSSIGTMKTVEKKSDKPTKAVLDLVPSSVPEDWHRHENGQGWVYKNAKVAKSAWVWEGAVVYDNAKVMTSAIIYENAKVFGNAVIQNDCHIAGHSKVGGDAVVHYASHISDYAKIFGIVEKYCQISGKTYVRPGVTIPANSKLTATPVIYRTQKAKGLSILESSGFDVPKNKMYKIERLKTKKQLESLVGHFVRPCPVTPRHGFVDSRSVTTLDDAKKLIKETKAADKEAEFIVMPFIKASHSGIWTEGQLSIGTGNDGATSGRDSLIIPIQGIPSNKNKESWSTLLKDAGITQSPYLELLWSKDTNQQYLGNGVYKDVENYTTKFVQLRDGPKLPNTTNFIPKETVVTNVILAEGDLLEWESKVKSFQPGIVVYHPGGSLASHYAIHAYLNNIPILIDKEPKIGDILKPDTTILKPDIDKLRKGFQLGCTLNLSYHNAAYIMMAGCHSTSLWLGKCDLFLGMAMGCCYRLLVAASLGEFRRYKSHILHEDDPSVESNREKVYAKVWDIILEESIKTRFASAMKSFDEDAWGGSIGGVNWYILSRWGALIYNSLIDGDEKAALEALNKGTNSVHNGGWTFNKFISQDEMNQTAKNPIYSLLKVAPILYDTSKLNFIENQLLKYEVKEIKDVEEYIAQNKKGKYQKKQSVKTSSVNINKKCCSNDCCGNPDCTECHPAIKKIYESCPYQGDFTIPHAGKETTIHLYDGFLQGIFPVCEAHLSAYLDHPHLYKLYDPTSSQSEPKHKPELECDCLEHDCSDCYPDGCGCECTDCHDKGCKECCGCGGHDCNKCYPNGCDCSNTKCHDCKWNHCNECNPNHDGDHCPNCYANSDGTCTDPNCEKCYPEPETETE